LSDPRIRKSINISRVCQDALRREVHKVADLPTELFRLDQIIARLREEKSKAGEQWFIAGTRLARDWVEHEAPYALLRQLGETHQEQRLRLLRQAMPEGLKQALARHREEPGFNENNFLEGWAHMLGLLWEAMKKSI
jgi:hypothetical protein